MCPLYHLPYSWGGDKASLEEVNLDKKRGKTEYAGKQQPNNSGNHTWSKSLCTRGFQTLCHTRQVSSSLPASHPPPLTRRLGGKEVSPAGQSLGAGGSRNLRFICLRAKGNRGSNVLSFTANELTMHRGPRLGTSRWNQRGGGLEEKRLKNVSLKHRIRAREGGLCCFIVSKIGVLQP